MSTEQPSYNVSFNTDSKKFAESWGEQPTDIIVTFNPTPMSPEKFFNGETTPLLQPTKPKSQNRFKWPAFNYKRAGAIGCSIITIGGLTYLIVRLASQSSNNNPIPNIPTPAPVPTPAPAPTPPSPTPPSPTPPPGPGLNATVTPYKDFTLNAHWDKNKGMVPESLVEVSHNSTSKAFTLAFIIAERNPQNEFICAPAWGSYADYSISKQWGKDEITKFIQKGGEVMISFGGQIGPSLQGVCLTDDSLYQALESVINTYGVYNLDFDVETSDDLKNLSTVTRLASNLQKLQQKYPLTVSLTLPVLPNGLNADGLGVLQIFAAQNVELQHVNIMAMDYGQSVAPNAAAMGQYSINATISLFNQLQQIYPNKSAAELWKMTAVTPMIGINDVWNNDPLEPERFTLEDAAMVRDFCAEQSCQVRYWSITRDHPCTQFYAANDCSGALKGDPIQPMQTTDYEYAKTFLNTLNFKSAGIVSTLATMSTLLIGNGSENESETFSSDTNTDYTKLYIYLTAFIVILPALLILAKTYEKVSNFCYSFWNKNNDINSNKSQTEQNIYPINQHMQR